MFVPIGFSLVLAILLLITYGILQWLHLPAGTLFDWLIAIASFWWLVIIVTVPWNIYFEAQEILAEAATSREKGIEVKEKQVKYTRLVARWSIIVAIALHILSAIGLYTLAATGISAVGYIASSATLLLTALRPIIRGYEYLVTRLSLIRNQIKYPREDVLELRRRFEKLEKRLVNLEATLDLTKANSWATTQENRYSQTQEQIADIKTKLEQLKISNTVEHQQLSKEANKAIAKISEDSEFLGHVREIIRFFKES